MEHKNYYEILGVKTNATKEEIIVAKKQLVKKYHPDTNLLSGVDTTEQMLLILEAFKTLSDDELRKEYDLTIKGQYKPMQTFNLREESESTNPLIDETIVECWKASGSLAKIVEESILIKPRRDTKHRLSKLSLEALPYIMILKGAEIPDSYWHPEVMNWLLFAWYQNRNYTIAYLLSQYDLYVKNDLKIHDRNKIKKKCKMYQKQIKHLLKY